jgi:hypothetical protein
MYKKDKQGIIIVLVALTVLLATIAFQWHAVIALRLGLTVVIVHVISEIHQRLRCLNRLRQVILLNQRDWNTENFNL